MTVPTIVICLAGGRVEDVLVSHQANIIVLTEAEATGEGVQNLGLVTPSEESDRQLRNLQFLIGA